MVANAIDRIILYLLRQVACHVLTRRNITLAEQCATHMAAMCRSCDQRLINIIGPEASEGLKRKSELDGISRSKRSVERF